MSNNNIIKEIIGKELIDKNLIYPFVRGFTQREMAILSYREQKKPLEFIGKKFNITRERVRQIEMLAEAKIEYSGKIVERLAEKIGERVFTEREVERAFLKMEKGTLAERKIKWQRFGRSLWKLK